MYRYKAIVTAVYDADTITVDVDLGFRSWLKKVKIRLYGINAPEVRGIERPEGLIARDWLREQILGKPVVVHTYKDSTGKYGRWLADVYPVGGGGESYNNQLVATGHAKKAEY